MNYHHFTIEERCCLREYYVKGKSYREIGKTSRQKCEFGYRGNYGGIVHFSGIYRDIIRIRRKRKAICETVTVTAECSGNKRFWIT